MLVVALTGGIGSGKTTVADRLAALGAGIIDTDQISRELTARGSPTLEAIARAFGPEAIGADGALDRDRMRGLVFRDPDARARLEAILHPAIKQRMLDRLRALDAPYAVLVIPLLLETGQQALADRVLVVDLPAAVQIERVARRSGLEEGEIRRIIASQASREQRLALADDLVDNSGEAAGLDPQLTRLHAKYLELARRKARGRRLDERQG